MTQLTPTAIRAASLAGLWADLAGIGNAPLDLLTAAVAAALDTAPNGDLRDDDVDRACRLALERAEHKRFST